MSPLCYGLGALLALQLAIAVYHACMALLAVRVGIELREVQLGFGPTLLRRRFGTWTLRLCLLPIGGSTQFKGFGAAEDDAAVDEDAAADEKSSGRFDRASGLVQLIIVLSGPLLVLAMGVVLVALPILARAPTLTVTDVEESQIRPCAFGGLAIRADPATVDAQVALFRDSLLEGTWRLVSFQSLDNWGGYTAFLITCGKVGEQSDWAWVSLLGVMYVWLGLINLVPLPTLNGFHACCAIYKMFTGRMVGERPRMALVLPALLVIFVWGTRFLYIDARWIYRWLAG